jgi:hypothetical protein
MCNNVYDGYLKHENSISGVFGIENYKDILRGHFSFE